MKTKTKRTVRKTAAVSNNRKTDNQDLARVFTKTLGTVGFKLVEKTAEPYLYSFENKETGASYEGRHPTSNFIAITAAGKRVYKKLANDWRKMGRTVTRIQNSLR